MRATMRATVRTMMRLSLFVLCVLAALLWVGAAHAGVLRVALLQHSSVRGDAILLSDLLPQEAPQALREAASSVSLGLAPQNGSSRQISRANVLVALSENGLPADSFVVPEVLTVTRAGHLVTREEVYAAIRRALTRSQSSGPPPFRLDDISLDAAIFVSDDKPALEVTDMVFDEFLKRARFRLWDRSAPAVRPFFVTARVSAVIPGTFHSNSMNLAVVRASLRHAQSTTPFLIEPNRLVRLHLHSPNSSMLLEVKTLQRGRFGDVIRVRLLASGKTLRARVVGGDSLEASF